MTDHFHPDNGPKPLPEADDGSLALRNNSNNSKKSVITEDRFVEGIKTGFEAPEISHLTEAEQDDLAWWLMSTRREA